MGGGGYLVGGLRDRYGTQPASPQPSQIPRRQGITLLQLATGALDGLPALLARARDAVGSGAGRAALLDAGAGRWDAFAGNQLVDIALWCCADAAEARPMMSVAAAELAKLSAAAAAVAGCAACGGGGGGGAAGWTGARPVEGRQQTTGQTASRLGSPRSPQRQPGGAGGGGGIGSLFGAGGGSGSSGFWRGS